MKLLVIPPIRNDGAGSGHYGASRGSREHEGTDRGVYPGSVILAPEWGTLGKYGYAYADDLQWRIVDFHGGESGYHYRFFYCELSEDSQEGEVLSEGEPFAIAQDITLRYPDDPEMTPHVHIEIYDADGKRLNPEEVLL